MSVVSTTTLKTYFNTGDYPTEAQFVNLIDTLSSVPVEMQIVDTVDLLRAEGAPTGDDPTTALTRSCSCLGDFGGQMWYWDADETGTDNTGQYVKPTGVSGAGRWVAIRFNNRVTVDAFGGDTTSDSNQAAIQAAIDAYRVDRSDIRNLLSRKPSTTIIDFCGQKYGIDGGVAWKDGITLANGGLRLTDDVTYALSSEFFDEHEATDDEDYISYWLDIEGTFVVELANHAVDDYAVQVACDWMQWDRVIITGRDDNDCDNTAPGRYANEDAKGLKLYVADHAAQQPRTYFAESVITYLKVTRLQEGAYIESPDLSITTLVGQTCPDIGVSAGGGIVIEDGHIYGCRSSFHTSGTGEGIAFRKLPGAVKQAFLTVETSDIGFSVASGFYRPSNISLWAFRNAIADVVLESGGHYYGRLNISSGEKSNANLAPRGIWSDGGQFYNTVLDLADYGGALNFAADRSTIRGHWAMCDSASDYTTPDTESVLDLNYCSLDLVVRPQLLDDARVPHDLYITGIGSDIRVVGAPNQGEIPTIHAGVSGGDDISYATFSVLGNGIFALENDDGHNQFILQSTANNSDHSVSGLDSTSRITGDNQISRYERDGIATFSGNGSQTTFNLPVSIVGAATAGILITPMSADAQAYPVRGYFNVGAGDIPQAVFSTAPANGTDNVVLGFRVFFETAA